MSPFGRLVALCVVCALVTRVSALGNILYLTMHGGSGGVNSLRAYALKNRTEIFRISPDSSSDELRGMASSGAFRNGFVAQAKSSRSAIYKFPLCGGGETTVLDGGSLSHPYGLAFYKDLLLITNQDVNQITTFNVTRGKEVSNSFPSIGGMRGIAVDTARGHVFVTSRDSSAVLVFDFSGNQLGSLPVDHPIGVHVSPSADALFVTDGSSSGVLRSYTLGTFSLRWTSSRSLQHGAGMDTNGGTLYVVEQDTSSVLMFAVTSGNYLGQFISNLSDSPEQIMIGTC